MPLHRIELFAILGSVFLIILILELIRRGYLNERYSLLWLTTGGIFLVLSLSINWLKPIALFVGFQIVSNALFFAGIIFLVIIALGLTVAISNLSERNKKLTQEIALLKKWAQDLQRDEAHSKKK